MVSKLEKRLRLLERVITHGAAGAAGGAVGRYGLAGAARGAGRLAVRTPYGRLAMAGLTYRQLRIEMRERDREAMEAAGATPETQEMYARLQRYEPGISSAGFAMEFVKKRKTSKANKAVKYAMDLLKQGGKAATGAAKGKLPKKAFKLATQAAGLANKDTPSKIGKGASRLKALARKIRKRFWK